MGDLPSVHEVKRQAGWLQNRPYCPADLEEGPCPGDHECPGLKHKTAGWVVQHILIAIRACQRTTGGGGRSD